MIYFTSDTHFGHANIIKYCGRPFASVKEMDEVLVQKWNDTVTSKDTVYHLGDIAMGDWAISRANLFKLNGQIFYLTGNHHSYKFIPPSWQRLGAGYGWELIPARDPVPVNISLNHYAQRIWNKAHHGAIHLFGHSHGQLEPYGKSVDVGVDSPWITGKAEYRPFSLFEVLKWASTQPELKHHDD